MSTPQKSNLYTWSFLAAIIVTVAAGIIIAFALVDPCACRKDLDALRTSLDAQRAEILQLYQNRADESLQKRPRAADYMLGGSAG